jgi:NitT/TauT family transport system substrate-binding protein
MKPGLPGWAWIGLTTLVMLGIGCSGGSGPPAPAAAPAKAPPAAPAGASAAPTAGAAPVAAAPAAPTAVPPLSPPVALKLGLPHLLADVGFFVAQDRGYFAEEGLEVEFVRTPSLNEVIPAVSTGEMDAASGGIGAALFNAVARGLPMKMVADRGTLGPGSGYMSLVIRKDLLESGQVRDFADLRGLTIAASSAGAITELVTVKAAERGGLRPADVKVVYLGIGDTPAALVNRSIDGAMALEPNVTLIVNQGSGDVFRTTNDIVPNLTVGVVMYADNFIRAKPEAARRFMVAYLRGIRDFNDAFFRQPPRGRAEVIAALVNHTGVRDPQVYETMTMPGLSPDGGINLASIADAQQWWHEQGQVREPVDVAQLWDGSYLDHARARLGHYQR